MDILDSYIYIYNVCNAYYGYKVIHIMVNFALCFLMDFKWI